MLLVIFNLNAWILSQSCSVRILLPTKLALLVMGRQRRNNDCTNFPQLLLMLRAQIILEVPHHLVKSLAMVSGKFIFIVT
jgi:hypothetical protein